MSTGFQNHMSPTCPHASKAEAAPAACPHAGTLNASPANAKEASGAKECPVLHEIMSDNKMYKPDQAVHAGQQESLGTHREVSSIPRSALSSGAGQCPSKLRNASQHQPQQQQDQQQQGTSAYTDESNWVYPSEQMFYNAMSKKGWTPEERDMESVVAIHNSVNERAWRGILAWESLHKTTCPCGPTLTRFEGRPKDLTPKARFNRWLGRPLPFDRHDWMIDRCGMQVRYVIDFYSHDLSDDKIPLTVIDVRPAIDTFGAFVDRFKMKYQMIFNGQSIAEFVQSKLSDTKPAH